MSLARRVAANTAIQLIGKVVSTLLGVVTIALIQRALKPAGFGSYTIVMSYLGFFSVIADFGLYVIVIRELNKPGADRERVFANVLGIRLTTVACIFALGLGLLPLFGYSAEVNRAVLIGVFAFLTVAVSQLTVSIFQSALAMRRVVVGELIGRVISLTIVWLAVQRGLGLPAMIAAVVAANAANLLFLLKQSRAYLRIRIAFDAAYWRYLLRETTPVALSVAFNLVYFRMDTIILSLFRSPAEVGLYGAAYKILDILNSFPIMFVGLMLPILTQALAQDRERFQRLYQRAFDALVMAVVPLIVGGWVLARPLLVLIGGPDFAAAAPVFRLLLIAVGFLFLNSLSGHSVTIVNKQRQMVWGYLAIAILGIGLYLTLIPRIGMRGAAVGTIVTEAASAIIGSVVVFRTVRFRVSLQMALRVVFFSLMMGLALLLVPGERPLIEVPVGIALYLWLLLASRTVPVAFIKELIRGEQPTESRLMP